MKRFLISALAVFSLALIPVASASADNETIKATTDISAQSGGLFKASPKPANLKIRVDVSVPPAQLKVTPLKRDVITFPADLTFNPDNKVTPVCPDSKFGPTSDFSLGPKYFVEQCGSSVIGTGTSTIYAAKVKANRLTDPVLLIFNNGTDNQGNAKIKIYGYSKLTGAGIYMSGVYKNHKLDIAIPPLSYDSSIEYFELLLPGPELNRPDMEFVAQGKDPNYVQAVCSTGVWKTTGVFTLGERDPATSVDTSTPYDLNSAEETQNCTGAAGKAKVKASVTGPKSVKNGAKGKFKVKVTNSGTGIAKSVKVTATGGGKASVGNLNPGASKTVTVKTKVSGRKGKKATIKFTVKGSGVNAKASAKVKVK